MINIQKLIEEEWIDFKIFNGNGEEIWKEAIREVSELNNGDKKEYRAVFVNGPLTHIYCSGFYTVPTVRHW